MTVDKKETSRLSKVLTLALLLPPLAWLAQLLVLYSLVTSSCVQETRLALHLTTAVALVASVVAGAVAWKTAAVTGAGPTEEGSTEVGRIRFMAIGGVAFAIFFVMVALATHMPVFLMRSCS